MSEHADSSQGGWTGDPSLSEFLIMHFSRRAGAQSLATATPSDMPKTSIEDTVGDPDLDAFRPYESRAVDERALHEAVEESAAFESCLEQLAHGDELDCGQALVDLTGRYRKLFIARLLRKTSQRDTKMEPILEILWRHLDVIFISDRLWKRRDLKLSNYLARADAYPVGSQIRQLVALFNFDSTSLLPPHEAVSGLGLRNEQEQRTALRTLLAHPLESYRSYAVSRLDTPHCWSALSLPRVPVTILPQILYRLSCSDAPRDHRKVFLDCTFGSLAAPRSEQQVQAAREILHRFVTLDFSFEDRYFERLMKLHHAVEKQGRRLEIDDAPFRERFDAFRREKERRGSRKTRLPGGVSKIPLTVQRKLAREGHYLKLFICHPHPKIALETAPFINTPRQAEAVLRVRTTNRRLVSELSSKRELFTSYRARLALLSNPHTPLAAGLEYLAQTREEDLKRLRANRDINPEIRSYLKSRANRRAS